ncbi:HlyB/MsbA family ABC transporter [Ephemerocybe angulata]|uniref:HlyB/MsbA family ABC transporter n=1 Tax=Ephemerocybe angulata TaxID=980116 RepID=A0A8H6M1P5_9AGAR|nr:HlyB/MsbA family ABC transporter [Tulosesus angulatus]
MPPEKPSMLFDPDDTTLVRQTQVGVWHLYEDISGSKRIFSLPLLSRGKILVEAYNWGDISGIEGCKPFFFGWLFVKLCLAFIPAISLWYTGQLLRMVETAVETRSVDMDDLFRTGVGRRYYSQRAFQTIARLDVPTYNDNASIQVSFDKLKYNGYSEMTWNIFVNIIEMISSTINLVSQFTVLIRLAVDALGNQRSMWAMKGLYAYKTEDKDYVHSEGLKSMVSDATCRKDMVAGGLGDFLWKQYQAAIASIGDKHTDPYSLVTNSRYTIMTRLTEYMRDPIDAVSQVYTCLKVVQSPSSAPFSLATLQLVNNTMTSLNYNLYYLGERVDTIADSIDNVRAFYELLDCPNVVKDGTTPFPENQLDMSLGISIEFKNVSFKYKESDDLAVKNVSFKIEQGQLCVIVGENGSGKSTILTLITRIYDATEGEILLNGINIKTLKLADVRKAVAVLFQEYAIFPMTLGQNIGYGDPANMDDIDKIRQAAKLGGAEEFIDALPYKYDTFVTRPVYDHSYGQPSSTSAFAGKTVDFKKLKLNERQKDFSGGQKQRVALSRTFMKSLVSAENTVGLLLFDEPSASLDPRAEHDLFTRLRELRGSKTMVFSSHRFGKLTRHADLILYIHKGEVLEAGNHVQLLKKDGEYAKFWNLQAQDFL